VNAEVGERDVGDRLDVFEPRARGALRVKKSGVLDARCRPLGRNLEQLGLVPGEVTRGQAAHMENADHVAAH
jgi:hypothetical protein